jgi:2-oxo-3-hexenedioate decarboxylase
MDPSLTAVYAEEMIRLADTGALAEPISACVDGFDVEDAYRVAREVLRRREASGWRRVGRKIGFTNRTIWDQYGVYAPIFGYMYDRTVSWVEDRTIGVDGWGDEATLSIAGLTQPLIEPELAFHLRETLPLTDDPVKLLGAVDWIGHGFEIVQCHFPDWKFAAADTIADGGLHGRYVVGPGMAVPRDGLEALAERLGSFTLRLSQGGKLVAQGGGELVLGNPLNALAYLVKTLAALPEHPPLQAGELVTTGTLTTALPVAPGETWSTRIAGLPIASLVLKLI